MTNGTLSVSNEQLKGQIEGQAIKLEALQSAHHDEKKRNEERAKPPDVVRLAGFLLSLVVVICGAVSWMNQSAVSALEGRLISKVEFNGERIRDVRKQTRSHRKTRTHTQALNRIVTLEERLVRVFSLLEEHKASISNLNTVLQREINLVDAQTDTRINGLNEKLQREFIGVYKQLEREAAENRREIDRLRAWKNNWVARVLPLDAAQSSDIRYLGKKKD